MSYDLTIIGSGPGGYVAALCAAKLGAKVALVEKSEIGGVCLNQGCIPTKALAAFAHKLNPHFAEACEHKQKVVETLRQGIEKLLKGNKIEIIKGEAKFTDSNQIAVNGKNIDTKKILIATGSAWWTPPGLTLDHKFVITSDDLLNWKDLPKSILIVGGGVVGCEFASILNNFGVQVSIVEAMNSLLPMVEGSLTRLLANSFKQKGINVLTGTTVVSVCHGEGEDVIPAKAGISVLLSNNEEKNVDKVLVCVGRRPNTTGLDLEKIGIELTEKGAIKVNEKFETNVAGVYAIGDVIGNWMLAHVASAEAISCVEQIFGKGQPLKYQAIPSPIFTIPEIGAVGLTSEQLKQQGINFKTGRFAYAASGKAWCDNETEGMALVHVDDKGKILGAHILGKDATLLIAEAALAIEHGLTAHDVGSTIHAHPTLSEIFAEACLDAVGEAIHKGGTRSS
ncbi:MAG: dihydrolipoyl dehydrogenase [Pseudomonadota bacterium]